MKKAKINNRKLIFYAFLLIYLFLTSLNFKDIIGFNSVDELMFTNFDGENNEIFQYNYFYTFSKLSYYLWSKYVTTIYNYGVLLPIYLNVFFFFFCFNKFYKSSNCSVLQMILMLSLPSLVFFTITYLRDVTIMSFVLLIISFLYSKKKDFRWYCSIAVCVLAIILLRPIISFIVILSLILTIPALTKYRLYKFFPLIFCFIGLAIYYNIDIFTLYTNTVISVEPNLSNFGLVGFKKINLNQLGAAFTFLFNWIPYWYTYNLIKIDSIFKIIFVYESTLLFILLLNVLIKFRKNIFTVNRIYRFCFSMILFSLIISSLESGQATILRHKLIFMPCLFYCFFSVNKIFFGNLKRKFG